MAVVASCSVGERERYVGFLYANMSFADSIVLPRLLRESRDCRRLYVRPPAA